MHATSNPSHDPFSGIGDGVHGAQPLTEYDQLGRMLAQRQTLLCSANPHVRSAAAAAMSAKGTTRKPPDTESAFSGASAHHLAHLLAVWSERATLTTFVRAREATRVSDKSPVNPIGLIAVDLPAISLASENQWFESIRIKVEHSYGGLPLYPGSHLAGGLHDFHEAMQARWDEELPEVLRAARLHTKRSLSDDERHQINRKVASNLHAKWVDNLRKAFGRVLRTWPYYWELAPHSQKLEVFVSEADAKAKSAAA